MLSIIVARSRNGVIGRDNGMPWHLPGDLRHFKKLTMHKPMIMGRKTFESLPGVLPGRPHIIISRQTNYELPNNCCLAGDLEAAIAMAETLLTADQKEIMVVGGAEIYAQALALADRLYITEIAADIEGDTFFPSFDAKLWRIVEREEVGGTPAYSFVIYERKTALQTPP